MEDSDRCSPERFIAWAALTCMVAVAVMALVSVTVDPYLLFDAPRIEGFNARRSQARMYERLTKPYEVLRWQPDTVLLGTSRVAEGFDVASSAWPADARPVYNLSVAGSSVFEMHRLLQHLMAQRPPQLVLLGLDFEKFWVSDSQLPRSSGLSPDFEGRLNVERDGSPNPGRPHQILMDRLRVISAAGFNDSLSTIAANLRSESDDMRGGWMDLRDGNYRRFAATDSIHVFTYIEVIAIRRESRHRDPVAVSAPMLAEVDAILALCQAHGSRVIVFTPSLPASYLEIFDKAGLWPAIEAWKRSITAVVAKRSAQRAQGDVVFWDFVDYDSASTEPLLPRGTKSHWYRDLSHLHVALADRMVERMLRHRDDDIGVVVRPDNLEQHLLDVRERQQRYRMQQSAEVQRVTDLYQLIVADMQAHPAH